MTKSSPDVYLCPGERKLYGRHHTCSMREDCARFNPSGPREKYGLAEGPFTPETGACGFFVRKKD
jgi:hypothetical protein